MRALVLLALATTVLGIGAVLSAGDGGAPPALATQDRPSGANPGTTTDGEQGEQPATVSLLGGGSGSVVRYIANPGAEGVGARSACDEAATADRVWPNGTLVVLLETGSATCAGWSRVAGSGGASWVRSNLLDAARPAAASATASARSVAAVSDVAPPAPRAPLAPTQLPTVTPTATPPPPALSAPPAPAATLPTPTATPPPAFTLVSVGGAVLTDTDLDGRARLLGGKNGSSYLGLVSSSTAHPDSICNADGKYGSAIFPHSVRNPVGQYGTTEADAEYSAYNPSATSPPRVLIDGTLVGYLTTSGGANAVDPGALLRALGCS